MEPDILHFLQVPLLILLIFLENYQSRLSTGAGHPWREEWLVRMVEPHKTMACLGFNR